MATTTFLVRQFYNIPSDQEAFTAPSGVFVVTGSESRLLVNNTRTNLANDSFTVDGNPYSSNTSQGWWPGPQATTLERGIIVGGNDNFANPSPDGRTSTVSCYGFIGESDQETTNVAFIELAGYILGTTYENTGSAKTALRNAGFYYQYPRGFDGQSPNTGNGAD